MESSGKEEEEEKEDEEKEEKRSISPFSCLESVISDPHGTPLSLVLENGLSSLEGAVVVEEEEEEEEDEVMILEVVVPEDEETVVIAVACVEEGKVEVD